MMRLRNRSAAWAIAGRDIRRQFSSPLGYLLLTGFVVASAMAAFWPARFFLNNIASLHQLNRVFPYLAGLVVAAMTMGVWAEEKRHGTDELLLTLPAQEWDITAGKYLAMLGIYTAAIVLSASHVIVLALLGSPDPGVMAANYFAFWLIGAALIPIGMCASLLHSNVTITFVLGVVFTGALIGVPLSAAAFGETWAALAGSVSLFPRFANLSQGLIDVADVLYFAAVAALFLYLDTVLLGRIRWPDGRQRRGRQMHIALRGVMLAVALGCVVALVDRARWRVDVTVDRQHSLSGETRQLVAGLPRDQAVRIEAFVSPDVPQHYVQTREELLAVLRSMSGLNPRIQVDVVEALPYSPAAQRGRERYGIAPRQVADPLGATEEVYLGIALRAGAGEYVVPFLDRGLSAEYEVGRALRVVTGSGRKRVGIVDTDVKMFGGIQPGSGRVGVPWQVVDELRKQYEVVEITPYTAITEPVDALLVVLPSRLTGEEMALVAQRIGQGTPTLIVVDPLSLVDLNLAPAAALASSINPFRGGGAAVQTNYGDVRALLYRFGVNWAPARIAWDRFNPHPAMSELPAQAVFVAPGSGNADALSRTHPATSGLAEVLMLYPGYIQPAETPGFTFEPLLQTGGASGATGFFEVTRPTPTGPVLAPPGALEPDGRQYVLAAHVRSNQPSDVIVVADLDFISDYFFDLRTAAPPNASFDNIAFFLNAVDVLAGDASFITLRNRHRVGRTLTYVETETQRFLDERAAEERQATAAAEAALEAARERLKDHVDEIKVRRDLDEFDRDLMVRNYEASETRRLRALESVLTQERDARVQASRETMEQKMRSIRGEIRLIAAFVPPLPVLALGLVMMARRVRSERGYARISHRLEERV
jgi:ABC-2 type transport system permease protein